MCNTKVNGWNVKKYFSIGEAAKAVHTTTESLRHYDRIGLVKPSKKDEWTNYRYYTEQDIVRLNTVRALQLMDLSLNEIRKVLGYEDLEKIVAFLSEAEAKADEKIASLQYSKSRIRLARADYEKKLHSRERQSGTFIRELPERVILPSDTLEEPTLDNLWNYLARFYDRLAPEVKDQFLFEDLAGIYTENDESRLFALCLRYAEMEGLKRLPEGKYLCATCSEDERKEVVEELIKTAKESYGAEPSFVVQLVVVSGILLWDYEVQVCLE